tara:strand:+ start:622 stop:789 length:168 start_codon:yes stop_codon:yes gene_type:complete
MRIGDLVKCKNVPWDDYGIVISISGQYQWAEVYWTTTGYSYSFFADDLEVVNENR